MTLSMTTATMRRSEYSVPENPRRRARRRRNFAVPHVDLNLRERRQQENRLKLKRGAAWVAWRWVLGLAAWCEFVAYQCETNSPHAEVHVSRWQIWRFLRGTPNEELTMDSIMAGVTSPLLTLLYSLYFLDAFVQAKEMWVKTFTDNEKGRLLHGGSFRPFWNPHFAYVATLVFYLSLLPTWFWWRVRTQLAISSLFTSSIILDSAITHPRYSLGYAIFVHVFEVATATCKDELHEAVQAVARNIKWCIMTFAIYNPRKFMRGYRKASAAVIWIKYLQPISSHVRRSEMIGILTDIIRSMRQAARKRRQKRRRRRMWARMDSASKRELSAIVVQRNYRAYCSRKWVKFIRLEAEKRETEIILLVQKAISRQVQDDLEERENALVELERLQREEKRRKRKIEMNGAFNPLTSMVAIPKWDREYLRRKYQLQEEVQKRLESEKGRLMLLRPDSNIVFHCAWIYVLAASIETMHLVLQPRLDDETRVDWLTADILRPGFRHSSSFINVVLCVGVFIKAFVGEFDSVNGCLKPPSFVTRWIYPGLLLHLIVNPAAKEIKQILSALIEFSYRVGPGRLFRWWILFQLPFWNVLIGFLEWKIWMRIVQRENQKLNIHRFIAPWQRSSNG